MVKHLGKDAASHSVNVHFALDDKYNVLSLCAM